MNELASERATVAERHNYYKIFFLVERVRHIDHRRWLPVPSVVEGEDEVDWTGGGAGAG